jgi:ADP-heptose:LPS heptosyltransferase
VRIAVIRFSSFGDILCTGPAVRGIRNRFPEAKIVYITTPPFAEIAKALPEVDEVLAVDKSIFENDIQSIADSGDWDHVADLQGSDRSRKLRNHLNSKSESVDTPPRIRRSLLLTTRIRFGEFLPVPVRMIESLTGLGAVDDGASLDLNITEELTSDTLEKFGDSIRDAIVFVPGAKHHTKCWPSKKWIELLGLIDEKEKIVIVGAKDDTPDRLAEYILNRDNTVDMSGQTTPLEAAALIKLAKGVVTGDTGPMHLAVAVKTPLVALFGPTVKEFGFYPFRAKSCIVIERNLFCRPCSAHGADKCILRHHKCLDEIAASEVFAALNRVIEQSDSSGVSE